MTILDMTMDAGQRNYVVDAANDAEETDEEAEMEKVRAALGHRD